MGSSEDYLDSLLRSMGVPEDQTSPDRKENTDFHIDSAPSLEIPDETPTGEEDLSDLMNDLMSKIDTADAPKEEIDIDAEIASLLNDSGYADAGKDSEPDRVFVDRSESEPVPEPEPEPEPEPVDETPFTESESEVLSKILGNPSEPAQKEESENTEFDLDAELAELLKEENESEGLPDENDIEAMLGKAREEGLADDPDRSEMSLDELIAADSGSVSDIGSMLSKNDNNEAVDPGIEALLSGGDEFKVPSLDEDDADETSDASDKDARKLSREEKKEAKKKAREEKARQKALAKENRKKKNSGKAPSDDPEATAEYLLGGGEESAPESAPKTSDAPENEQDDASNNAIDEADSLLAEIMGGSFGSEFAEMDQEGEAKSSDSSAEPALMDPDEVDSLLEAESGKKKKKGLFSKLLDLLTDTDEEEEDAGSEIKLSDENAAVLQQLDAEGEEAGKKKKKKKKKKGKKGEGESPDAEGSGEDGEGGEGGGRKKKKKEKKPKPEPEETGPVKKLNKKKVISIFAFCLTLLIAVLIISRLMGNYTVKKEARQAYSVGDYQTTYQDLFGQDLNESDEIIFKRSECILRIRLWQREYELLRDESDVKALDSLIQTVYKYPALYESAIKWACLDEVDPVYRELVDELKREYGLTEEEALEIAQLKSNVDYTRAVYDVVNGSRMAHQQPAPAEEDVLVPPSENEDVLPGENDPGSDVTFVNP